MGFIESIYGGMKSAKPRSSNSMYDHLEDTPFLYGSEVLNEMYEDARTYKQEDIVYRHMERYDVIDKGCEGYDRLAAKYERGLKRRRSK